VLVTGASGGVGGEIVSRLRALGRRVRILVRRPPQTVPPDVEVALGDLADAQAVDRAVRGAKIVIHAGAAMKGGWPVHEGGTVNGTRNVLAACKKYGVQKLVHISSMSVVDWAGGDRTATPIDESAPLEPRAQERGNYTRAKLAAEQLVSQAVLSDALPAVILRPGQIFGGKLPLLTAAVARRLGKRWLILGRGDVRLPLVHIDDVVDAVILAADGPMRDGQIIQLVDEWTPTQNEVLAMLAGPSAKVIRIPRWLVMALGWVSEVMLGLVKRPSPLSRYRLKSALSRRNFRSTCAGSLLGWQPRLGASEGVRRLGEPVSVPEPKEPPRPAAAQLAAAGAS
jgi:nucleoside-diphosphate-sugar epimerase